MKRKGKEKKKEKDERKEERKRKTHTFVDNLMIALIRLFSPQSRRFIS